MPVDNAQQVRILIVDDHPIVRHGLVQLIEQEPSFKVTAQASSAEEAVEKLASSPYDLAVVDVSLKGVSGLELIKQIRERGHELPVLVMSMHDEDFYAERALRAGAQGYIMKQRATSDVVTAIQRVLAGDLYLSKELSGKLLRRAVHPTSEAAAVGAEQLSDRELEVLQLLGQGVSTREVAEHLSLSVKTVESYRANIKRKLGLKNAAELMRYAVDWVRTSGEAEGA